MQYKKTNLKWFKDHFTGLCAIRYKQTSWKVTFRPQGANTWCPHEITEVFSYDSKNDITYISMWDNGFLGLELYEATRPMICVKYDGYAQSEEDLYKTVKEYLFHCREELFNEYEEERAKRKEEKES